MKNIDKIIKSAVRWLIDWIGGFIIAFGPIIIYAVIMWYLWLYVIGLD